MNMLLPIDLPPKNKRKDPYMQAMWVWFAIMSALLGAMCGSAVGLLMNCPFK